KVSAIWSTSSRVGASTSARGGRGQPRVEVVEPSRARRSIVGIANAAVLPVPVWAHPMRSRPSRIRPIARARVGVGGGEPTRAIASRIAGVNERSLNEQTMNETPFRAFCALSTRARRQARAGANRVGLLDLPDVGCLKTLRTASHLELDPVTFSKAFEALG